MSAIAISIEPGHTYPAQPKIKFYGSSSRLIHCQTEESFKGPRSSDFTNFMRRVVLFIAISLDGFMANLNGSIDWLFTDQDYNYTEFFDRIDTVIMGNKTYQQILGFGEYPYPGKQGFVISRSQVPGGGNGLVSFQANLEFVPSLVNSPGKDIWLVGGAEVIRLFAERDWIDELILSVHPIALGQGIPLFLPNPGLPRKFQLTNYQVFDTGLVQLSYSGIAHG